MTCPVAGTEPTLAPTKRTVEVGEAIKLPLFWKLPQIDRVTPGASVKVAPAEIVRLFTVALAVITGWSGAATTDACAPQFGEIQPPQLPGSNQLVEPEPSFHTTEEAV